MTPIQQLIWDTMFTVDWSQFVDVTHCTEKRVSEGVPAPEMQVLGNSGNFYLYTFIDAPTGSGKNHFVTQVLAKEAKTKNKKILVLSNRNALDLQQKREIIRNNDYPDVSNREIKKLKMLDNIVFLTYQSVCSSNVFQYFAGDVPAYIVFDEAHFLCADAAFNANTEGIMRYILTMYPLIPRIYMSATLDVVKPIIRAFEYNIGSFITDQRTIEQYEGFKMHGKFFTTGELLTERRPVCKEYYFEPDYQYVSICFFKQWKTIISGIKQEIEAENSDKWIIFVSEIETGKMLYREFSGENASFVTAASMSNAVDNSLVNTQLFPKKVLICTSVLDNGVSIHDDSLKNIVIDFFDKTEFMQMLGRKRVRENESITVYARTPTFKEVKTHSASIKRSIQDFERLEDNPLEFIRSRWGSLSIREQELVNIIFPHNPFALNQMPTIETSIFTKYALTTQEAWYDTLDSCLDSDPYYYAKQVCEWLRKTFSKEEMLKEDISPDDTDIKELRMRIIDAIENCIKKSDISDVNSDGYVIPAEEIKNLGNKIHGIIKESSFNQNQFGVIRGKGATNVKKVIESMALPYELSSKGSGTDKNTYLLSKKFIV